MTSTTCPLCLGEQERDVRVWELRLVRTSGPTPTTASYAIRATPLTIRVPCDCVDGWPTVLVNYSPWPKEQPDGAEEDRPEAHVEEEDGEEDPDEG